MADETYMTDQARKSSERIERFRRQAKDFKSRKDHLESQAPRVPPEWQNRYDRLLNQAADTRSKIEAATHAVDSAYRYGQQVYGLDRDNMNQLGILPLIPWAVVSAGGAAMAYFANDAATFNKKLDELERLQELGYSKQEALEILDKPRNAGAKNLFFRVWQNPLGKVAVAGGGLFLGYKFAKAQGWL